MAKRRREKMSEGKKNIILLIAPAPIYEVLLKAPFSLHALWQNFLSIPG